MTISRVEKIFQQAKQALFSNMEREVAVKLSMSLN